MVTCFIQPTFTMERRERLSAASPGIPLDSVGRDSQVHLGVTNGRPKSTVSLAWRGIAILWMGGLLILLIHGFSGSLGAQEPDQVTLNNATVIFGTILEMTEGTLLIKTGVVANDPISVPWDNVVGITTTHPLPWVLTDGTTIQGIAEDASTGRLVLKTDPLGTLFPIPLASVKAINPPARKLVRYTGNLNLGGDIQSGNTNFRSAHLTGEITARSEQQRLHLRGRWNYGDRNDAVITRNAFSAVKLDFFVTKRMYVAANGLFEQDTFQDLNIRSALGAGPGYQFIEQGDFSSRYLTDMEFYGEVGVAFLNEDFKQGDDQNIFTGRWAVKLDWDFLPVITFFHYHEAYPGFDKFPDLYITTEQGFRFTFFKNFIATTQVNWRFNDTPSPGFQKADTQYLLTLGYAFDL